MKQRAAVLGRVDVPDDGNVVTPLRPGLQRADVGSPRLSGAHVRPLHRYPGHREDRAAVSRIADECQVLVGGLDVTGVEVTLERFIEVITKSAMPESLRGRGAVALLTLKLLARFADCASLPPGDLWDPLSRASDCPSLAGAVRAAAAALGQAPPARPEARARTSEAPIPNTAKHALLVLQQLAYRPGIKLHQVATIVGISPSHLDRLLKRHVGQSFVRLLNDIRVSRASWLLDATTLSVKEVTYKAGFNSATNFCRTFRRSRGCTPKQWRSRAGAARETT